MSGTIAQLGIEVNSGDAVQAATDLERLAQAGVKAEKAADGVAAGFDKAATASTGLATAEGKLSESTEDAMKRLTAMAKASLDSSDYYQRSTTSINTNATALDNSGAALSSVAAMARRFQAESDALVGSTDRQADAAKKAAAATGVQAEGLQALLAKINPTIAAYEKLDQQQELLKQHLKAGNIDSDQFKAYSADIEKTRSKLGDFDDGLKKTGVSSRQTEAALRQLPAQFSDIFTSLAGGQNPLMVLIQQGGQIKDSFGGVGATFDALGGKIKSLFTGGAGAAVLGESLAGIAVSAKDVAESTGKAGESLSGLAEGTNTAAEAAENAKKAYGALPPSVTGASMSVVGMTVAVLAAAAAIGVLIYGYSQGSKEAEEYNKALILTGNYAGTSADQMANLAQQVSATNGTTGEAAASLTKLAASGVIAGGSFKEIADAAAAMEDATGKSVDATIAEFVKIAKDPVAAAKELNDQYNFLTASTYAQIVALKEQGDTVGAADLLTKAYADTVQDRSKQVTDNLGLWQKAWKGVKDAASGALDGLNNVGRAKTYSEQIEDLKAKLTGSNAYDVGGLRMNAGAVGKKEREDIQGQIRFIELQQDAEKSLNDYLGDRTRIQKEGIAAEQRLKQISDSNLTNAEKRDKLTKAYLRDVERLKEANPDDPKVQADYVAKTLQNIKDKNKDPKAASSAGAVDLTAFNAAQNALKEIQSDYSNTQKQLDAAQKAGLISQESYASQRSVLISAEKEEVTAAYQAEIDALEAAKAKKSTTAEQSIELDNKIAGARSDMLRAQKAADSQQEVLATAEEGRLKQLRVASEAYVTQLERQRAALDNSGTRAAQALGLGDRQAGLQSNLDGVTDKFNDERAKLLDRRKTAPDKYSNAEYEKDLAILENAENKYRDTVIENYEKISAAQGDWRAGATSAFQNYMESARDVAGQTKSLFTNAFSSMEDAIVNFAMTGKLSFADFTKSILADMARIASRQASSGILKAIVGAGANYFAGGGATAGATAGGAEAGAQEFGSQFDASSASVAFGGGRATGGGVDPNTLYEVNEKGPELYSEGGKSFLMTGANGGSVTPLTTGGGPGVAASGGWGGSPQVYINISSDGKTDVSSDQSGLESFGAEIGKFVEQKFKQLEAKSLSPQGNIRKAIQGRG
ncbi:phage tail tape measure protein [Pseudomonas sp. ANT_J12]|uniref:phage tail tape measure protein n=1 Tax=Pseudomonas sp. ANT_J12 TaxID=2597351 RepID=UPI0011F32F53|nr:phage tail tape measure protein [Pseudomonas sp. ANT_J12]KAA0995441.1 phage tail tape measure protein [Pseudomonas sp. ANT_J12]